jgi:ATP-binding cassette, subfamily B, bacterial
MSQRGPLLRLLDSTERHRRQVMLACLCSVLNKFFDLAPPVLIGLAVDVVVEREDSFLARMGYEEPMSQLVVLGVLTVIIWALESVFEYLWQVLWRNLAQTVQHELRQEAFEHVLRLDMGWFRERSTGELMAVLNDDVNQLERFLDSGANDLLQVATTAVVVGGTFFWVSPIIALFAMFPIPIILWGSFRFQSTIAPRYADVRERAALVNGQLSSALGGIETIKAFTTETHEVERITKLSDDYRQSNRQAIRLSSTFSPLIRMAIVVGFTATLIYGGYLVLNEHLDVGSYSVLIYLTQRLLWPLTRLGQTFDLYQRAMASTTRILDLVDTPIGLQDGKLHVDKAAITGEIRFENIGFAYPGREALLQNFNLRIEPRQITAIVGPTGSGKSTLARLLLRFYDPDEGQITIDNQPLKAMSLKSLRQAIGFVGQDVLLFSGTIQENVAYAPHATVSAAHAAAEAAEATSFIQTLPDQWETPVGERGQKLSGGQAQRLSIARAVASDPAILILDEATSAVDNETEAAIQRSLERAARGRTTLVIAHRLSTIRNAGQIIVLDKGEIIESGKHAELIAADGLYKRLWDVQTGLQA